MCAPDSCAAIRHLVRLREMRRYGSRTVSAQTGSALDNLSAEASAKRRTNADVTPSGHIHR